MDNWKLYESESKINTQINAANYLKSESPRKHFFKSETWRKIIAVLLTLILALSLASCGKAETFVCDFCNKTIEDGKKYEVDSSGDTYNVCEDCYEEMQGMKNAF